MPSLKSFNCWKTLRADKATAQRVIANANAKNLSDWAISSQASWKQVEGSTTSQSKLNELKWPRMGTVCEFQKLGYIGQVADRKFFLTKDELADLYKTKSSLQIAKEYGVCKKTVLVWLKNYGIKSQNKLDISKDVEQKIAKALKKEIAINKIVKQYDVSEPTVRRIAKDFGIEIINNFHVGFITTHNGYKMIKKPDHPQADKKGYVREHRLVAEKKLGRFLTRNEVVHHIDHDKKNNHPDNLEIMTLSEHSKLHRQAKI